MRIDLTKITSVKISALIVAALIAVFAAGSLNSASAQRVPRRPRANAWAAQQNSNNPQANSAFTAARDLIDDAQWAKAEAAFSQYVSQYPKEVNLDAATYWMAYAEYQLKNFDKCKTTIDKLLTTYQKTIWKQDAELLLAQLPGAVMPKAATIAAVSDVTPVSTEAIAEAVQAASANINTVVAQSLSQTPAVAVSPEVQERLAEAQERMAEAQARAQERTKEAQERTMERLKDAQEKMKDKMVFKGVGDGFGYGIGFRERLADDDPCEFKIVVLQSLVESDAQKGVAAATDWLRPNSGQTPPCRRAALGVLARHGGKAALPTILTTAQNDPDIKVRQRAISLLGTTNDDSVIDPLRDFALNAPQTEISEAALYALSQHQSPRAIGVLSDIAVSNKPVPLRRAAISNIAGRQGEPAVDALFKIYDGSQDVDIRTSVIRGLGQRKSERAWTRLLEIARGSDSVPLRKAAISSIGRRGGEQSIDALMNLYNSEKNEEIKDQILSSVSSSRDQKVTHWLISIFKNPQTTLERRRHIVMNLAGRKDAEAIQFLEELAKQ